ncbi:hypothetical protein M9Y10_041970 [Tritrichomonas musculus]|uniref:Surface antigen BspA-like n=1 Tax=Tritrichomonas musculus TaxID=1915356 RepID=A0ABR2K6U0_9EUKA
MLFYAEDGLIFELNHTNFTAKVVSSPDARGDIFFPRSIKYQAKDYLIIKIEERAFQNNKNITSISFSDDSELLSIGRKAFSCCSLESLSLPRKVGQLEEGWCMNTMNLNHIHLDSNNKNFKYLDESHQIIVGKSQINSEEFDLLVFACRDVKTVFIPSSIKVIGSYAFMHCRLQKVTFEENSQLKTIEKKVFSKSSIKIIEIPPSVIDLKDGWLGERYGRVQVIISPDNKCYKYVDDNSIIVGKSDINNDDFDILVFADKNIKKVIIPASIKYISSFAFYYCHQLENVDFSLCSNLTFIGEKAFYWTSIISVEIPANVEQIEKNAFGQCTSLKTVNFSPDSRIRVLSESVFGETLIESFTITKNVEVLKDKWCAGMQHVTSISISNENKNFKFLDDEHKIVVGKSNQENDEFDVLHFACRDIEKVIIPASIRYIKPFAFYLCYKLKSIEFVEDSKIEYFGFYSFSFSKIRSIKIPSSLKCIDRRCFSGCLNLSKLVIPIESQLKVIKNSAFYLTKITNLYLPQTLEEFSFDFGLNLTSVSISNENKKFKYIEQSKLIIGKSNPTINDFDTLLFACRDVKKVFIPSSIKIISKNAFYSCSNLEEVIFENDSQLEVIDKAFCSSAIRQITIPSHVKYIGENCFSNCKQLETVKFENNFDLTSFNANLFEDCSIRSIEFPPNLKELKVGWCFNAYFLENVLISPENQNFKYYDDQHKIILGKSDQNTNEFDEIAFVCRDVKQVVIPNTIKAIKSNAFNSIGIDKIFIPKNVQIIDEYAFYECKNLESIQFEEGSELVSIKDNCFAYTAIKNIIIPKKVEKVDWNIFLCCHKITTLEFLGDSLSIEGFISSKDIIIIISFPNVRRFELGKDLFLSLSDQFSLFVCANAQFK